MSEQAKSDCGLITTAREALERWGNGRERVHDRNGPNWHTAILRDGTTPEQAGQCPTPMCGLQQGRRRSFPVGCFRRAEGCAQPEPVA